ncbi:epoxyqueuosine reductase [Nocardia beijingensis]|uniref:epoxyqueuosine reductase n=1 Tax=Nocardia beijingensis TaxID=95162 RepID=UPI0018937FC3|nr:4Fe-4S binding protein [Nocardia beijingensis]MBF6075915.1 epoxyqueuosine reductase [Nocardia beijingensis]
MSETNQEPGSPRRLAQHPTVQRVAQHPRPAPDPVLSTAQLREICLAAGADDVGFVPVDDPRVAEEREHARGILPSARTYIAFCVRMNRDNLRSPQRSLANTEFNHADDETNEVSRRITRALQDAGYRAVYPAPGYPMEVDQFPGRVWVIAHKVVAQAAGLGVMGIHRNVIHPKFGNFILLGTVVTDAVVDEPSAALDFNPCLECKLCVSACPVGAITDDGGFDFQACYTHNYREFMGGFTDWAETIADSADRAEYRERVTTGESFSMWQSLSFKPNYKAGYCMAVCPAGEDVIGAFLDDRKGHLAEVVRPLQNKSEPVYVLPGSAAEEHVTRRFPAKTPKPVTNGFPDEVNTLLDQIGPRPRPRGTTD